MNSSFRISLLLVILLFTSALLGERHYAPENERTQTADLLSSEVTSPYVAQTSQKFAFSPHMFIENMGQFDSEVKFKVDGSNHTLWLTQDSIWISQLEGINRNNLKNQPSTLAIQEYKADQSINEGKSIKSSNIRISFVGANPDLLLEGFSPLDTTVSFFYGNRSSNWYSGVPVWQGVRYVNLYPGLDFEVGGSATDFRPSLVCHDENCQDALSKVVLDVEGADAVSLNNDHILISTAVGEMALPMFSIRNAYSQYLSMEGLAPAVHENSISLPLVNGDIRPYDAMIGTPRSRVRSSENLLYSTFLGGNNNEWGTDIVLDASGSSLLTGFTISADFPTTPGTFDTSFNSAGDVFVAKLDSSGSALEFSTFLGGSSTDSSSGIGLHEDGSITILGSTASDDFPMTQGAYDPGFNDNWDVFVTKINSDGSELIYSTYLGGSEHDYGAAIDLDSTGQVFIAGNTGSSDFPISTGGYDNNLDGSGDVFLAKLNADGNALVYSTFLGGSSVDTVYDLVSDVDENVTIVGTTSSDDFPTTLAGYDRIFNGVEDIFVTRMNDLGSGLIYSTFLGGSHFDDGRAIVLDDKGNAIVTGATSSSDYPSTSSAFDPHYSGFQYQDVVVTKLNIAGSDILFSTFIGGSDLYYGGDMGTSMGLDSAGNIVVAGQTNSLGFPTTNDAYDKSYNGSGDVFIAKISPLGSRLLYSTFVGGSASDGMPFLASDFKGNVVITGVTSSPDFPITQDVYDDNHNDLSDAFITKMYIPQISFVYLPKIISTPGT